MSSNLLSRKLTLEEIEKSMKDLPDFIYNVLEGGYVSKDLSVILINNRRPYIGMLLQFMPDVKKETLGYWIGRIEGSLEI